MSGKSIDDILRHFDGVKKVKASEWTAHCPVCEPNGGRTRHLYIGIGTENPNAVTVYCHHYCELDDILSNADLTKADLFLDAPRRAQTASASPEPRTVAPVATNKAETRTHVYNDVMGLPLCRKNIRKDADGHKTAWWEHYDSSVNGWVSGAEDTPLYNLDELATSDAKTVFICEGEKDCNTLISMGLTATSAGGAKNWKDRHTEQLKQYADGKIIVILTDNDSEGENMGKSVSEAVAPIASELYVIPTTAYWKDAPVKADITDYVEACTAGMESEDATAEIEAIKQQLRAIVAEQKKASEPQPFETKTADAFKDAPHRFVWNPYIPLHQYTVILADAGTGKSTATCGIAAALTTGQPLPSLSQEPRDIIGPVDVLFISSEDSGAEYKARLSASGADLSRCHVIDCDDSIGLDLIRDSDRIVATAKALHARLIIVDPWQAFIGEAIDLNRMNQVRPALQRIAHMARNADAAVILISHVNKRAQGENANNAASGSSELINAARSAFKIVASEEPTDGKNTRLIVHTKSNYAALGKSVKFRIEGNGGLEWAGFSDVSREDLERAARSHKTVSELMADDTRRAVEKAAESEAQAELANAIMKLAMNGERQRRNRVIISYQEIADEYGEYIYMGKTPKVAIGAVRESLRNCGFELTLDCQATYKGKHVRAIRVTKTQAWNKSTEDGESNDI